MPATHRTLINKSPEPRGCDHRKRALEILAVRPLRIPRPCESDCSATMLNLDQWLCPEQCKMYFAASGSN